MRTADETRMARLERENAELRAEVEAKTTKIKDMKDAAFGLVETMILHLPYNYQIQIRKMMQECQ